MPDNQFNRDEMARWYARRHVKTDPGIRKVYHLPAEAPKREIRFVEINEFIADRDKDALEPIDFGVDLDSAMAHTLYGAGYYPGSVGEDRQQGTPLAEGLVPGRSGALLAVRP